MSLSNGSLAVLGVTAMMILLAIATYNPGEISANVIADIDSNLEVCEGPDLNCDGILNIHDLVRGAKTGNVQEAVP